MSNLIHTYNMNAKAVWSACHAESDFAQSAPIGTVMCADAAAQRKRRRLSSTYIQLIIKYSTAFFLHKPLRLIFKYSTAHSYRHRFVGGHQTLLSIFMMPGKRILRSTPGIIKDSRTGGLLLFCSSSTTANTQMACMSEVVADRTSTNFLHAVVVIYRTILNGCG